MTTFLKDHQISELVNKLRNIAIAYHAHQSLRCRISNEVNAALGAFALSSDASRCPGHSDGLHRFDQLGSCYGKGCDATESAPVKGLTPLTINYTPGSWYQVKTHDELEAFFLSRLPAIREAAKELGYAIGVHGSLRRDFDLIAVPWREENVADKDVLAHAIAMAAVGITRNNPYQWEDKPLGRKATSIPCAWTPWHGVLGSGNIDLSVTPALSRAGCPEADTQSTEWFCGNCRVRVPAPAYRTSTGKGD